MSFASLHSIMPAYASDLQIDLAVLMHALQMICDEDMGDIVAEFGLATG